MDILAGRPDKDGYRENKGHLARFKFIDGILQRAKDLIVSDSENHCLRRIDKQDFSTRQYAGQCQMAGDGEGALLTVRMMLPRGMTFDPRNENLAYLVTFSGDVYQLELDKEQIWQWHKSKTKAVSMGIAVEPETFNIIISTRCDLIPIKGGKELKVRRAGNGDKQLCSPISGFDFVTPSHLIAAAFNEEKLIHFDLSLEEVDTICVGYYGHNDGWIDMCELYSPTSVCALPGFIYIGESGMEGGGVRRLSYNLTAENESLTPINFSSSWLPTTTSVKVITANIPSLITYTTRSKPVDNLSQTTENISSESPEHISNSSIVEDRSANLTAADQASDNEDMTTAGE